MVRTNALYILLLCLLSLPSSGRAEEDAAPSPPSAKPSPVAMAPQRLIVKEGDVVAGIGEDGKIRVMKVVKVNFQNGSRILHSVVYKDSFKTIAEAQAAYDRKSPFAVETAHLPIDGEGLAPDLNKVLGNEEVTKADRAGYDNYVHEMSH